MAQSWTVPYAPTSTFAPDSRLVDLLSQQGSDAAQFELQRGADQARLWNTIGQAPMQALGAYQQAQQNDLKTKVTQQAMESGAIDLSQKKKAIEDQAIISRIWAQAYGVDPSSIPGQPGYGVLAPQEPAPPGQTGAVPPGFETLPNGVKVPSADFIAKGYAASGMGDKIQGMLDANAKTAKAFADLAETQGKVAIQTANALGATAQQAILAIDHGVPPQQAFSMGVITALVNKGATPDQIKAYVARAQDTTQIRPMLEEFVKASEQQRELGAKEMTAQAAAEHADIARYGSEAGVASGLAKANIAAANTGGVVPAIPPMLPRPGLPVTATPQPPRYLNPDTGQPILTPDTLTAGGDVVTPPSAPQGTSRMDSQSQVGGLPIHTETPVPPAAQTAPPAAPVLTPDQIKAKIVADAYEQVHGGAKAAPGPATEGDTVLRARRLEAARLGRPLTDAEIQGVDAKAMQAFKAANQDPDMRDAALAQKNLAAALVRLQLSQVPTKEQAANVAEDLIAHRISPSQMNAQYRTFGNAGMAFKLNVDEAIKQRLPSFNYEEAEAEYQLVKSGSFQNTVRFMESALESIPRLEKNVATLGNGRFRTWNTVANAAGYEFNSQDLKRVKTDALLIGDEVAKILSGGGTGNATSDAKLKQATDLFNTTDSVQSIAATIEEVNALLGNRYRALTRGTYKEGRGPAGAQGPAGDGGRVPLSVPPAAPPGWKYVRKPGGGFTAVEDK